MANCLGGDQARGLSRLICWKSSKAIPLKVSPCSKIRLKEAIKSFSVLKDFTTDGPLENTQDCISGKIEERTTTVAEERFRKHYTN
jgi:hypothetical protein